MSFRFAHPARLTPPICVNACGKNNNVTEWWDLWLPVVFCARCLSLFCFFWLWRGEDCVCYYDDKGLRCACTGLKMETPIPSIHPSIWGCVWVRAKGACVRVRACVCYCAIGAAFAEIWAIFARCQRLLVALFVWPLRGDAGTSFGPAGHQHTCGPGSMLISK